MDKLCLERDNSVKCKEDPEDLRTAEKPELQGWGGYDRRGETNKDT